MKMGWRVPPLVPLSCDTYAELFERGRLKPEEIKAIEKRYSDFERATFWGSNTIAAAIIALCCVSWAAGAFTGYCAGVTAGQAMRAEAKQ
jgi:hypothetical protein